MNELSERNSMHHECSSDEDSCDNETEREAIKLIQSQVQEIKSLKSQL